MDLQNNATVFETDREQQTETRWSETAYEWLQRSIQQKAHEAVVRDPSSAAWAFFRRPNTGVSFVDAAMKRLRAPEKFPLLEIRGSQSTGKTLTLITLAARFVVDTHPSRFHTGCMASSQLPQVVILDGNQDVVPTRVACAVRSVLLRNHDYIEHYVLDRYMASCLDRIHVVFSGGLSSVGWVSTLELLRAKLSATSNHPTLVLWDGFLSETRESVEQMEIVRQLTRLMRNCKVFVVLTCSNNWIPGGYDKLVTHRIRLEHIPQAPETGGHDFAATINGQDTRIPYSLSLGGALS